jgi:hypothetical protein
MGDGNATRRVSRPWAVYREQHDASSSSCAATSRDSWRSCPRPDGEELAPSKGRGLVGGGGIGSQTHTKDALWSVGVASRTRNNAPQHDPVRLIGANPFLVLYSKEVLVAYASVWRIDWSERGAGAALVLWLSGSVRVIAADPVLGLWLAEQFTRHFPEVRGLPWPDPAITVAAVEIDFDLERGMTALGADVQVDIVGPALDRRLFSTDSFDLGGTPHLMSTVLLPCPNGRVIVGGTSIAGAPQVSTCSSGAPSSTAMIAVAEVWCRSGA